MIKLKKIINFDKIKIDKNKDKNNYMISVDNLSFSFNGVENILENISFKIFKGDLVAIIGPNGMGKSTLIKLILGIYNSKNKKSIFVNGRMSYIPQKFNQDVNFPATVSEILNLECCECNLRSDISSSLGIKKLEDKQFKSLSGGQQQRVFIALSLLSNPDILILDEPTIGFDTKTQEDFYVLLKKLNKERNLTILFVTHDTSMISSYFTKTLCVYNKTILIDDSKNTHIILHKTYGCSFHKIHDERFFEVKKK